MKTLLPLMFTCVLAMSSLADDTKTNSPAGSAPTAKSDSSSLTFPVTAATITAPFVLTNGCISQPDRTDLPEGGKAVFTFTIANAGNYLVKGIVNAPDEESNSFYVNVDTAPEDPMMIWDIEVTTGYEERTVNWRGSGDSGSGEFMSKKFKLSAGEHKLIVMGREPAQLKSVSIVTADK